MYEEFKGVIPYNRIGYALIDEPRATVISHWAKLDQPAEAICGAVRTSYEHGSGLHIGVWNFGAGRFLVNTLRIGENLGEDPAADRLLCNMLNYMARGRPAG